MGGWVPSWVPATNAPSDGGYVVDNCNSATHAYCQPTRCKPCLADYEVNFCWSSALHQWHHLHGKVKA